MFLAVNVKQEDGIVVNIKEGDMLAVNSKKEDVIQDPKMEGIM